VSRLEQCFYRSMQWCPSSDALCRAFFWSAGDIDPAIVPYLAEKGMSFKELDTLMNKKSGFLGLAGSVDLRAVMDRAAKGDERSALAVDMFVRRVRKYMGAYWMHLGGKVDAIVFSAGIGENAAEIRRRVCDGMAWAGVDIDDKRNDAAVGVSEPTEVSSKGSKVKVMVVPTDEELSIAEQTLEVMGKAAGRRGGTAAAA